MLRTMCSNEMFVQYNILFVKYTCGTLISILLLRTLR